MNYLKVRDEKAHCVQYITDHEGQIIKSLFVGVKESVSAVIGQLLNRRFIQLESHKNLYPNTDTAKICRKALPNTPYILGGLYYPKLLKNMVYGNTERELALQSLRLFKAQGMPLIPEWAPALWTMCQQRNLAVPAQTFGIDGEVWQLYLPPLKTLWGYIEDKTMLETLRCLARNAA